MKIQFENNGNTYAVDLDQGISLARPLSFDADQSPNVWNAPQPKSQALLMGSFVGDTRAGGSCNVEQLSLIPHCNGTHTETIGHIIDANVFVAGVLPEAMLPAVVVTVSPQPAAEVDEAYLPALDPADSVVTAASLSQAFKAFEPGDFDAQALVIRTLPNTEDKFSKPSSAADIPFLTNRAMDWIVERGFAHLLVDLPSVDRLEDEGMLSNHSIFWNVKLVARLVNSESRLQNTITESIYVPDRIEDGPCLLSIQIPAFQSDAAPSRPLVYPLVKL